MLVELGTPHAAFPPDATRRFGPSRCASGCSCPSRLAIFGGSMRSTEARFCGSTLVQCRYHSANSLFCLNLSFIPVHGTGLLQSVKLGSLTGGTQQKASY